MKQIFLAVLFSVMTVGANAESFDYRAGMSIHRILGVWGAQHSVGIPVSWYAINDYLTPSLPEGVSAKLSLEANSAKEAIEKLFKIYEIPLVLIQECNKSDRFIVIDMDTVELLEKYTCKPTEK